MPDLPNHLWQLAEGLRPYRELVLETEMDQWPAPLLQASIPAVVETLAPREAVILFNGHPSVDRLKGNEKEDLRKMTNWFDYAIKAIGGRAFIKIGTESFDQTEPVTSGQEVLDLLYSSGRLLETLFLRMDWKLKKEVAVVVREWVDLEREAEFRVFVKDEKIVGISQRYCDEVFESLQDQKQLELYEKLIKSHVDYYIPALPRDLQVVDVWMAVRDLGTCKQLFVPIVDVKPYAPFVEPKLFSWDELSEATDYLGIRVQGETVA